MENEITLGTALFADALTIAFLLLIACIKGKIGLYNSFMPLVVTVLALVIGITASQELTPLANKFFYPKVEEQVVAKFDDSVDAALNGLNTPKRQFQRSWNNLLEGVGIEAKPIADQVTEPELVAEARELLKEKTEKTFNIFAGWVLFGIGTAIGLLLLTLLKNLVGEVSDWPVIKWFDYLGGFAIGLLEAFLILFVVVKFCGLVGIDFFADKAEGTHVLSWFTEGLRLADIDMSAASETIKDVTDTAKEVAEAAKDAARTAE